MTDPATHERFELPPRYDPAQVEARWVRRWAERPFAADPASPKPPFTIVIPPPNVTGNLHLGHAFDNAIIDALIRFKRLQGFEALFQPGTDHAGISTQVQVERALQAEGSDRHTLGREAFLERMWAWKERFGGIILEQLQRLGVSADWTRTRFTLDDGLSRAVRKQFVELFHRGRVYRGERIVHWDPLSRTTLSDLEVDREERPGTCTAWRTSSRTSRARRSNSRRCGRRRSSRTRPWRSTRTTPATPIWSDAACASRSRIAPSR